MADRAPLMSTIVRVLKCGSCNRAWNWMDANWPRYCPFCGGCTSPDVLIQEVSKYVAKVPARA